MVQLQLFDTTVATPSGDNSISVEFKTVNDYRGATVGLQNRDGTAGLTHVWNENYPRVAAPLRPLRALRFETAELTGAAESPATRPAGPSVTAAPNPFRRATMLTLGRPGQVAIRDVAGRVVRTLSAGRGAAGVVWDVRDDRGRRVPAGTYFASPSRGRSRELLKLVLLP
jgi:hypothetical protein